MTTELIKELDSECYRKSNENNSIHAQITKVWSSVFVNAFSGDELINIEINMFDKDAPAQLQAAIDKVKSL